VQLVAAQPADDCEPGRVQLPRRRRRPPSGDAIRLLDD
jgi:hypothetical protein